MTKPQPLPWFGGKGRKKGQWITSQLPWERDTTYVEPFAGMLGVLLERAPVKREIVNDLDERVVNWWRVVREQSVEFGRLVEGMPHSRREFELALSRVGDDSLPAIERALAFQVVVTQGMFGKQRTDTGYWRRWAGADRFTVRRWPAERVAALAQRIWNVQIECCDALSLLEDFAQKAHMVIYCDPPYRAGAKDGYRVGGGQSGLDVAQMTKLLLAQRGRVAVSGMGNEWDHLGWRRAALEHNQFIKGKPSTKIEEVLWMNYPELPNVDD